MRPYGQKTFVETLKTETGETIFAWILLGFVPFLLTVSAAALLGSPGLLALMLGLIVGASTYPAIGWAMNRAEWREHHKWEADTEKRLREMWEEIKRNPPPPPPPKPPAPPGPPRVPPIHSGRTRQQFPITGPEAFVRDFNHVLDRIQYRAPHRYTEILEYLPKAQWAETLGPHSSGGGDIAAHAGGMFTGSIERWGLDFFLFMILHETGHNVHGHTKSRTAAMGINVEAEANEYTRYALADIGRIQ